MGADRRAVLGAGRIRARARTARASFTPTPTTTTSSPISLSRPPSATRESIGFEVWNEPNYPLYWGGPPEPNDYSKMLKTVGDALHQRCRARPSSAPASRRTPTTTPAARSASATSSSRCSTTAPSAQPTRSESTRIRALVRTRTTSPTYASTSARSRTSCSAIKRPRSRSGRPSSAPRPRAITRSPRISRPRRSPTSTTSSATSAESSWPIVHRFVENPDARWPRGRLWRRQQEPRAQAGLLRAYRRPRRQLARLLTLLTRLGARERRAPEDVVLGGLDLGEPEGAHDLDQDDDAGDDRRGSARVQAGHLEAIGQGHGRQLGNIRWIDSSDST